LLRVDLKGCGFVAACYVGGEYDVGTRTHAKEVGGSKNDTEGYVVSWRRGCFAATV
jgi:hypothetical protein